MSDFTLPELGENVTAGDVVRILVKPGDTIAKEQPVLELETDKATIEVPSSVAGTVTDVKVKQGDKVKVGQSILTVDDGEEGSKKTEAGGRKTEGGRQKTEDGKAEDGKRDAKKADGAKSAGRKSGGTKKDEAEEETEAAAEGGLTQKTDDDSEEEGAEEGREDREGDQPGVEDAPATQKAPAAASGKSAAPRLPEDEIGEAPRQRRGEVVNISREPRTSQPAAGGDGPAPAAGPSVRRMARELGVEIRQVSGSGPGGRITIEDVQAYVRQALQAPASDGAPASGAAAAKALPDFSKWGEVERKPMSNIRRKTSEHLGYAWNAIPHVTQHDKADITGLETLRKQFGKQAEQAGGKLTVTAVALKILAGAVRKFPQFAASIDPAQGQIVYKKFTHIGVAVDTDRGLLVPVIRDVDRKGIIALSAELAKASEKARTGKLSLDDMSGGIMTITNLGGIGGTSFTPIVNWPEVAILGLSRGGPEPVWNGSAFEPRLMLPLSLSYDHRVIDGADAARFLRWVAEAFEQPFVLAL